MNKATRYSRRIEQIKRQKQDMKANSKRTKGKGETTTESIWTNVCTIYLKWHFHTCT